MKLTVREIALITEALDEKRSGLKYYAEAKDDDGTLAWPDEAKKYEMIDRLIKKIESMEV